MTYTTPTQAEALLLLRRLKDALKKEGIPVHDVFLFGSVAKGTAHAWSDIDVAVICDPFRETRHEENMVIRKMRRNIDVRISPICIHPEELEGVSWQLPKEVQKTGVIV